jgi:hypothetical protein
MASSNLNTPVPNIPYFTPQNLRSPGTPKELFAKHPCYFTPLQIRNVTLRNRIIVAPMCQYSAPRAQQAPTGYFHPQAKFTISHLSARSHLFVVSICSTHCRIHHKLIFRQSSFSFPPPPTNTLSTLSFRIFISLIILYAFGPISGSILRSRRSLGVGGSSSTYEGS